MDYKKQYIIMKRKYLDLKNSYRQFGGVLVDEDISAIKGFVGVGGFSCYINTALQILYSLGIIREIILNTAIDEPIINMLKIAFNHFRGTNELTAEQTQRFIHDLIHAFHSEYSEIRDSQEDTSIVVVAVLRHIHKIFFGNSQFGNPFFAYTSNERNFCNTLVGHEERENLLKFIDKQPTLTYFETIMINNDTSITLQDVINSYHTIRRTAINSESELVRDYCSGHNELPSWYKHNINNFTNYMFIYVGRTNLSERDARGHLIFADSVIIDGNRYYIDGFALHYGTIESGHYTYAKVFNADRIQVYDDDNVGDITVYDKEEIYKHVHYIVLKKEGIFKGQYEFNIPVPAV